MEVGTIVTIILFVAGAILTIANGILAYFYKDLKVKVEQNTHDLSAYKTHIAENFVTSAQLKGSIDSLGNNIATVAQTVNRIEERLYAHQSQLIQSSNRT